MDYLPSFWRLQCSVVHIGLQFQFHQPVFHAFGWLLRLPVFHHCHTFPGKPFLFSSSKDSRLRSHSAFDRIHLSSFSDFLWLFSQTGTLQGIAVSHWGQRSTPQSQERMYPRVLFPAAWSTLRCFQKSWTDQRWVSKELALNTRQNYYITELG